MKNTKITNFTNRLVMIIIIITLSNLKLFSQCEKRYEKLESLFYWDMNKDKMYKLDTSKVKFSIVNHDNSYHYDRFDNPNSSIKDASISFNFIGQNSRLLVDSFTISFWYKSSNTSGLILSNRIKGVMDLSLKLSNSKLILERNELKGKFISHSRVCNNIFVSDSKWHFVTISFVNSKYLILQVDNSQSYTENNLIHKKIFKKLTSDNCGTLQNEKIFKNTSPLTFNCSETYIDDLLITENTLAKQIIDSIYDYGNWSLVNRISNCESARSKYLEFHDVEIKQLNKYYDPWFHYHKIGKDKKYDWPKCTCKYYDDIDKKENEVIFIDQSSSILGTWINEKTIWISQSLNVTKFRNGDKISHAASDKDWVELNRTKTPCWSYADISNPNSPKIYNYYALSDPRGLVPAGYRIASLDDWIKLNKYYKSSQINDTIILHRQLARDFWGYINSNGILQDKYLKSEYWTDNPELDVIISAESYKDFLFYDYSKKKNDLRYSEGRLVRYIKENEYPSNYKTLRLFNGDIVFGDFSKGTANGFGKYTSKNFVYEGDLKYSEIMGYGTMTMSNGVKYYGEWTSSIKDGILDETNNDGITERWLWIDDQKIAKEGSDEYNKLIQYDKKIRKLLTIDNGNYISKIAGGRFSGGNIGHATIYFETSPASGLVKICRIGVTAGGKSYTTENCIDLVSFNEDNSNFFLEFEGYIDMRKENHSIKTRLNSSGRYERKIEYEGSYSETRQIKLSIETTANGQILSFQACFLDERGYPDCGGFRPYRGKVNRLQKN